LGGIFLTVSLICIVVRRDFRQVHPEDFDKETLWAAVQEGRVYIEDRSEHVSKESIKKKVLAYVKQLQPFVTDNFRTCVDDVWEQIFACDELAELLKPTPKARKFRDFNKYNVMRIIGVLRDAGVYQQCNDSKIDAVLEHAGEDSRYRKYLGMGIEQRPLLKLLKEIVKDPPRPSLVGRGKD
jgi:hypothetical protein